MQAYYKYTFKLNASHSTGGAVHSHTFNIILYIRAKQDNHFMEYTVIENSITDYLNPFVRTCLNETDTFKNCIPMIENMAEVFFINISRIIDSKYPEYYELMKLEISDNILNKFSVSKNIIIGNCLNVIKIKED